jgi:glycine betaine/proline transport system substrate-binding protein
MQEKAPEVVEFLKNYETSSALTNEALAYMQLNEVDADETAKWFLSEYEEIWTKWVPEEVASKVKGAL